MKMKEIRLKRPNYKNKQYLSKLKTLNKSKRPIFNSIKIKKEPYVKNLN